MFDVIVAGGGVSGCMAAVAAARNGARTLLIERYGFAGGSLTNSGVGPMMSFHAGKTQVVKGLAQELVDRMIKLGGCIGHIVDTTEYVATVTPFEPEIMKRVLDEMLEEAGVSVLFHSFVCEAKVDNGRIASVTVAGKSGKETYDGKIFIDATGDGDLAMLSGARFVLGRAEDNMCQPMTTNFRIAGVDTDKIVSQIKQERDNFNIKHESVLNERERLSFAGFYRQIDEAKQSGTLTTQREDFLMFESVKPGEYVVNTSRIIRHNPTDPQELSRAEALGRKQCAELFSFLKREISGFENAVMMSTGVQIGVRESRHVVGDYELTANDLITCRPFDDAVARGGYPIDIHNPTGSGTNTVHLKDEDIYYIPYSSLVVADFNNLLVCGRCLSATHEAGAAVRVTPIAMATGQAVGTAAALSLKYKGNVRDVCTDELRQILVEQDVYL